MLCCFSYAVKTLLVFWSSCPTLKGSSITCFRYRPLSNRSCSEYQWVITSFIPSFIRTYSHSSISCCTKYLDYFEQALQLNLPCLIRFMRLMQCTCWSFITVTVINIYCFALPCTYYSIVFSTCTCSELPNNVQILPHSMEPSKSSLTLPTIVQIPHFYTICATIFWNLPNVFLPNPFQSLLSYLKSYHELHDCSSTVLWIVYLCGVNQLYIWKYNWDCFLHHNLYTN